MFHHVAEEVFLGPSTEQPDRILQRRLAEDRADQADLVPTLGQLADLPHPEPALPVADPRPSLGQFQRHPLAVGQRRFDLRELGGRPIVLGILVVGDAGDAVGLPHLLEELRAVPFAVEHDDEACTIAVGLEFGRGRLAGDILEQTRHDVAS